MLKLKTKIKVKKLQRNFVNELFLNRIQFVPPFYGENSKKCRFEVGLQNPSFFRLGLLILAWQKKAQEQIHFLSFNSVQ